ncbi:hypothetical protein J5N97_005571 [Dioscorea zingiberensis]|uniref:TPR repeat-containing thioredoxin TDX n=1 Tax=Dioscorea zingiberensis TaxID=325984 RepID=A0A9D5D8F2_9LILI|nr:hypothetical protein J5N97_005571 [Dioscorea zingiberensis]
MDPERVAQLKQLVGLCKSNPALLHDPSLGFFKDYLQSLGARVPEQSSSRSQKAEDEEDEIVESDLELDGDVIDPDDDPPQKMGDPSVEVSEESRDAAQLSKSKAMEAIAKGNLDEAIEHLTEAILLNPSSAILYATRASVFVKMMKPNAAVRDADAALKINPDSAKGYKSRGMARAMLGQWEAAASDLHLASTLDYDEEIYSVLKKVEPNVQKIEEHRRKYERLRKAREARKIQHEKNHQSAKAWDPRDEDPDSLADLRDGEVISVHSSTELEKALKAAANLSRLVILYFTATWCGPCRFMAPVYTSLAEKNHKVVFLKVDIDELGDVARHWNVSSVPTFFFVKNGKEVDKVIGADKNGLETKISQHMGKQ